MLNSPLSPFVVSLSIFLVLIPLGAGIYLEWQGLIKESTRPAYEFVSPKISKISAKEKLKIDLWIGNNNLNQYGDPKDTYYIGGTPLFDETTGETIDRYEYILKRHPKRPWQK